MDTLIKYFTTLPASEYQGLLAFLGGSVGISAVLLVLRPYIKRYEARFGYDAKKVVIALLGLMSFSVSVANDVLSSRPQSLQVLGTHAAILVTMATYVYHFGGSQVYKSITKFLRDVQTYLNTGVLPGGSPKS